jgi:glycerol kinase
VAARGHDLVRARGLHPDRRRGDRLVRARRRAAGRRRARPGARGALLGLSLGTTRADLARAVVDGILHQVADAADAIGVADLWVDGGLSRSDWIVQRLADLTGVPVRRTGRADSTALGAAALAGLAAGVWASPDELPEIPVDLAAEPALDRAAARDRWAAARELVARWR